MHPARSGLVALCAISSLVLAQNVGPFLGTLNGPYATFHEDEISSPYEPLPLNVTGVTAREASLLETRQYCGTGQGYCSGNNGAYSLQRLLLLRFRVNRFANHSYTGVGGCCPLDNRCCNVANKCVPPGWICCEKSVCPGDYKCCGGGCIPKAGDCCTVDGEWCSAGNICVQNTRTGQRGCCTDLKCTSYAGGPAPTTIQEPPRTTQAPAATTRQAQYEYYYYTITW